MRVLRLSVGLAVATAAFAALPALAAPEHPLAGTTTFTAARSSAVDVVMNNDAVIQLQPDGTTRDIALRGPGRMVAFSMTFRGNAADALTAVRTTIGGKQHLDTDISGTYYPQSTYCSDTDVPSVPGVYDGCTPTYRAPKYVVLHQGRYHVRVLTDGGPLTVTLQLHGLRGTTSLRTSKPLASTVAPMRQIDSLAGRYLRAQASLTAATTSELIYRADAPDASGARVHGATLCLYDDTQPTSMGLPTDYAPGCPGGGGSGSSAVVADPQGIYAGNAWFGGWDTITPGSYRFGMSLLNDAGVTYHGGWVALLQTES
jgi:hypothetical protein